MEKRGRGRPTTYDPQLTPPLAENLAKQGYTNEEIAAQLGIAHGTLYVWQNEYPELAEAIKKGKAPVDRRVENAFLKRAMGYTMTLKKQAVVNGKIITLKHEIHIPGDPAAAARWLNNRKPDEWREKQPEPKGDESQLRIIMDIQTNNDNVEFHLPAEPQAGEPEKK